MTILRQSVLAMTGTKDMPTISTPKYNKIIFFSLMIVLLFLIMAQVGLAETGQVGLAKTGANKALEGLNTTANQGYSGAAGNNIPKGIPTDISTTIGKIVGAALSFLGVAFFVLIIYGGYMWMFSMGNEQTAAKAKDIIIAAVIGLIIVLMAYAITTFLSTQIGV